MEEINSKFGVTIDKMPSLERKVGTKATDNRRESPGCSGHVPNAQAGRIPAS
jgi:hypothetical protein